MACDRLSLCQRKLARAINRRRRQHKHHKARIDPKTYAVNLLDASGNRVGHSTGEGQVLKFAFIATVVALAAKKTQQKINWLAEPTVAPLVLDAPFSALDPEYQGDQERQSGVVSGLQRERSPDLTESRSVSIREPR